MVSLPFKQEHALLGFLRQSPIHPYQIYQTLSQAKHLGRVWHLKQSHLYALLARLEEAGYISTATESQGTRPPRKVMSLTPSGVTAYDQWLVAPVAHGRDFRLEFLAKLYFASQTEDETVTSLIDRQLESCQTWLVDLQAQAAAVKSECQYDWLVLEFRIQQIKAIVSWLDTCAATFAKLPDS